MNPKEVLNHLLAGEALSQEVMLEVMRSMMTGQMSSIQVAAILVALRAKGETVEELTAAAMVMRELSVRVNVQGLAPVLDTCGTGGDGRHTFNVSTAVAFVAAAAGAVVAKHGGRAVSSSSGSAEVLEVLGVRLEYLTPERIRESLERFKVGFMYAPQHHLLMSHVIPVRKALGVRTVFNLLGPLTNPAQAPYQLLGVFSPSLTIKLAQVLQRLGGSRALVVHGSDGLDEITISGLTYVAELNRGKILEYELSPQDCGVQMGSLNELLVHDAEESAQMIRQVLRNQPGSALEIVVLNAGAALYVADIVQDIRTGVLRAREVIGQGLAHRRLEEYINWSQGS